MAWSADDRGGLVPSELDSARFGKSIGRVSLAGDATPPEGLIAAFRASGLDVLVVRYPAYRTDVAWTLASEVGDTVLLHADTLVSADGRTDRVLGRPLPEGYAEAAPPDPDVLEAAVRDVFADYTNHYAANPLTPVADVVDGYVEWADAHLGRDAADVVTISGKDGSPAAVAAVTYRDNEVEVDLAGVTAAHRRRGLYQALLDMVSRRAADRGIESVTISTQVHNLPPQRAWAQRGWLPSGAFQTMHLVAPQVAREVTHG